MIELFNNPFCTFSDGKWYHISYGEPIEFDCPSLTASDKFTVPKHGTIFSTKSDVSHGGYIGIQTLGGNVITHASFNREVQVSRSDVFKGQVLRFFTHLINNDGTRSFNGIKSYFVPYIIKEFHSCDSNSMIELEAKSQIFDPPYDGVIRIFGNGDNACTAEFYRDNFEGVYRKYSSAYIDCTCPVRKHESVYIKLSTTTNIRIFFNQYKFV